MVMIMSTTTNRISAFDQGRKAGSDLDGSMVPNPFEEGSPEHNNFEVGRRFGAKNAPSGMRGRLVQQAATAGEAS